MAQVDKKPKKSPKKPYTYHFTANAADVDVSRIIEEAVKDNQNVRFIVIKGKGKNCLIVMPEKLAAKYPEESIFGLDFPMLGSNMPHYYRVEYTSNGHRWITRHALISTSFHNDWKLLPDGWVCCTANPQNIEKCIQQALDFLKKPTVEVTVW